MNVVDITTNPAELQQLAESFVEDAIRAIERAVTEDALPFAKDARQRIPRRTGYLAGRFQWAVDRVDWTWRISIFDDAPYAPFVKFAGVNRGRDGRFASGANVFKTLLYDEAEELGSRMLGTIGTYLAQDVL